MRRFLTAVLVLLAVVIGLMPWGLSKVLELGVHQALAHLNSQPGVQAQLLEAQPGYWRSHYRLDIRAPLFLGRQHWQLECQVQQGPLVLQPKLALSLGRFEWRLLAVGTQGPVQAQSSDGEIYRQSLLLGLFGTARWSDTTRALRVDWAGAPVRLGAGTGEGSWRLPSGALRYQGQWQLVEWQTASNQVTLANARWQFQHSHSHKGPALASQLAFDALVLQSPSLSAAWDKGQLEFQQQPQGPLLDWHWQLQAQAVKSPPWQLSSLLADARVTGLPQAAVAGLWGDSAQQLQAQQQLAQSSAHLTVTRLKGQLADKPFSLGADTAVAQWAALPPEAWQSPAALLPQVSFNSQIQLHKDLLVPLVDAAVVASPQGGGLAAAQRQTLVASQVKMFSQVFLQQGLLAETDGLYTTDMRWERGKILLNNKPFSLPF